MVKILMYKVSCKRFHVRGFLLLSAFANMSQERVSTAIMSTSIVSDSVWINPALYMIDTDATFDKGYRDHQLENHDLNGFMV